MKLWRNVLVHVDGRPDTPEVLEKSLLVAEKFGGRVVAFDSIEPASKPLPFHFPTLRVDHLVKFAADARTEQLREELGVRDARVPVETMVGRGAAGEALLGYAAHSDMDLIVKATSADDVRQMTLSGAAALHLLRASHVPVWLYAPPARVSGRVVAAVNLSGTASECAKLNEHTVLAAAWLSLLEGAELHVVCVADRARDRLYQSILRPAEYRRFLARDRAELRQSLTELTTQLGARAVPHLVEGNALEALEKIVLELEADAVTLGRRDRDPCASMLGTYFAERLFCRLNRSVLLVASEPAFVRSRVDPRAHSGRPDAVM
jgi:nucleotide-binding universal stress UspA family protein